MEKRQRFSLRKYKIGAVSVLLGAVFLFSGANVAADMQGASAETTSVPAVVAEVSEDLSIRMTEVSNNDAVTDSITEETVGDVSKVSGIDEAEASATEPTDYSVVNPGTESVSKPVSTQPEAPKEIDASELDAKAVSESVLKIGEETPQNNDSNTIITVPKVWDTGYKGEGMVVAIIDSGLDVNHDVLQITDPTKAKYQTKEQLEAAKKAAGIDYGQWYNDKVIFGYNYVDVNTVLKEKDKDSHGMHVTGIAAGNPKQKDNGEFIYGVAPEAQVMFMRVFSDLQSKTGPALYVKAIDDAVALGADSINLSLGAPNGSVVDTEESVIAAIERARKAGISVVIAGGNEGAFGSGHANPLATNPDYGLVGNPSTAKNAISVASYNNTTLMSKVVTIIGLENDEKLNHGLSSYTKPDLGAVDFEKGKAYEYAYVGLGTKEELAGEFANVDLNGKLALIKRGSITFTEKIANAQAHGAIGVVVFNHTAGENNLNMSLEAEGKGIPSIFIPFEFGEALRTNQYKIQFNDTKDKLANPQAQLMSDFTSWGVSADGDLKPDLSAPGGSIYSSVNDGDYDMMSGTSMAAPHVAGAVTLVKQYLLKAYPDKTPSEIEALIKHLMMSTAKAHLNEKTNAYTSPRQQGAGILDTAAAISTGLYLTGSDNYGSISLGNVGDVFNFKVTLHNITNEDKTLRYVTNLNTDTVEEGHITLLPRELETIVGETVTVKANSSTTVTIAIDATAYREKLLTEMPNGYYLEGFVRFLDVADNGEVVSIPYVGFRGEFQNLDVIETPIYDLVADGKGGFYFVADSDKVVPTDENYTSLVTGEREHIYATSETSDMVIKSLGTFKDENGKFVLALDTNGKPHLAISPNKDGNQESLAFKGVFLRNYNDLVASVYSADDTEQSTPLWTSDAVSGSKNFFSGNPKRPKSSIIYSSEWDGTDNEGADLPDGHYVYVLTYNSAVLGANPQKMSFDVIIDRQNPVITTARYDETNKIFTPRAAVEVGESGIFRDRVFYLKTDEHGLKNWIDIATNGKVTIGDNKVYVAKNADGSFMLPLDQADIADFYYTVEDYAGNVSWAKVQDLIKVGNDNGIVTVNILDKETDSDAYVNFSYSVKDANGKTVVDIARYGDNTNKLILPFGTYIFELFLYDTDWSTLAGETTVTVNISEEKSLADVNFYVNSLSKAQVLIDIDKALPDGTTVTLVNGAGGRTVLPNAKYSPTDYGRLVTTGEYDIEIALPDGYEFLEELKVTVTDDVRTVKKLTLINKNPLKETVNSQGDVSKLPVYYNASLETVQSYEAALAKAQEALEGKLPQSDIDAIQEQLVKARAALDGKETNFVALQSEVGQQAAVEATVAYSNGSVEAQSAYDTAVRAAQLVLANPQASQKEVDEALATLVSAKNELNGKETDKVALRNRISKATILQKTSAKYQNASDKVKADYDKALATAELILTDESATQAEVNAALEALIASEVSLDGVETAPMTVVALGTVTADISDVKPLAPPTSLVIESEEPVVPEVISVTVTRKDTSQKPIVVAVAEKLLPATGENDSNIYLLFASLNLMLGFVYLTKKEKE
ncbi:MULTISPECIES: S8 family serine peptidase [Streptococcus]|uniref:S8 family serine peptidase n=1 Tax=Streptococcus caledonicus TaxID=2614158 RepID=A0ABW0UEX3_9STRE|nr:S8 family serine peptidase [Streptococcus sp. S784/96/1]